MQRRRETRAFMEQPPVATENAGSEARDKTPRTERGRRTLRKLQPPEEGFPGIRLVLLHSLAHALMRQIVLGCGYTSASVRERLYSRQPGEAGGPMAGILLYTAAPDSEGTLGGLVELGDPLTLVAGVLRMPLLPFVLIVLVAKGGRYLVLGWAVS